MSDTVRTGASRFPSAAALLAGQIAYQVRLLLSSGRAVAVGVGLPVILMVASKGSAKDSHPNVAGYAVFGLTHHRLDHLRRAPGRRAGSGRPQALAGHPAAAMVLLPGQPSPPPR